MGGRRFYYPSDTEDVYKRQGQHHRARRGALDGSILCAGIVDAVVGAPVAQSLVVDQLIAAVSIEHPARDRLRGDVYKRQALHIVSKIRAFV